MNKNALLKRDIVDNLDRCINISYKLGKFKKLPLETEYVKNKQEEIQKYIDRSTKEVAVLLDVIKEQKDEFLKTANNIDKEGLKIDIYNIRDIWTRILKPNDLKRDEPIEFNVLSKVLNEKNPEVNAHILKSNTSVYSSLDEGQKEDINAKDTMDNIIEDKPGKGLIKGFGQGLLMLGKAYWEINVFFFNLIYVPFLTAVKDVLIGDTQVQEKPEEQKQFRGDDDFFYPQRDNQYECHINPPS